MKNKWAKVLTLVACLSLAAAFGVACGGGSSNDGSSSTGNASESSAPAQSGNSENSSLQESSSMGGGITEDAQGQQFANEQAWVQAIENTISQTNATIRYTVLEEERVGESFMKQDVACVSQLADGKLYGFSTGTNSYYYAEDTGMSGSGEEDFESELYVGVVDGTAYEWTRYNGSAWNCEPYYREEFNQTADSLLNSANIYLAMFADMYSVFEYADGVYTYAMNNPDNGGIATVKFVDGLLYSYQMESWYTENYKGQTATGRTEVRLVISYNDATVGELPPMTWIEEGGEEGGEEDAPDTDCTHSFTYYQSNNDATCTEDGTKTAWCDYGCGESDTITDEGTAGHSFTVYVSSNNATCTQDGTKTATCDKGCGATDTIADEGSKLQHSFTDYQSNNDATCTEDGTKTAWCDYDCGESDTITDEGTAGHSFTVYVSNNNATCTQDGTKTATCDKGCGETDTIADEYTMRHDYVNDVCKDCGEEKGTVGLKIRSEYDSAYAYVSGYEGTETRVVIPSIYEGRSVRTIAEGFVEGNTEIKEIVLPSSITLIGNYAFMQCSALERINLPDGVTNIGQNAFYECVRLDDVTIPGTVKTIGMHAFYGCKNLAFLAIGDGVETIKSNAFEGCESLTEVVIPESVIKMENHVFTMDYWSTPHLTIYCEVASQPSGWASNWNSAYRLNPVVWNRAINSVANDGYVYMVVDGVRYALKDNKVEVTTQAYKLETANIREKITYQDTGYAVRSIMERAFAGCSSLTEVIIPESVVSLGDSVFYNCASLTKVSIPDSVEKIGANIFNECPNLQYTVKDSLKYVGNDKNSYVYLVETEDMDMTEVAIENGCKIIAASAFYDCRYLERVEIPHTVITIGNSAFSSCRNLTEIINFASITSIGTYAFSGCKKLQQFIITSSVTSVGSGAFYDCYKLKIYCEKLRLIDGWDSDWNPYNCPVYWYSEEEPALNEDGTAYDGNYWRYKDGEIVVWTYTKEE